MTSSKIFPSCDGEKGKEFHCETPHRQPWHNDIASPDRASQLVCHTRLWNGGNLGFPFWDTPCHVMSLSAPPHITTSTWRVRTLLLHSTSLNRWGGTVAVVAMNRCTMSDCPVHHFMWGMSNGPLQFTAWGKDLSDHDQANLTASHHFSGSRGHL